MRSTRHVLALMALVLALGFAGLEEGVVLCFGGDGHVALEASGLEGCSFASEAASRAASIVAIPSTSSHCGPCVDVALTASAATKSVASAKRLGPTAAAMPIAAPKLMAQRQRALVSLGTPTFIPERPHTVVIRC